MLSGVRTNKTTGPLGEAVERSIHYPKPTSINETNLQESEIRNDLVEATLEEISDFDRFEKIVFVGGMLFKAESLIMKTGKDQIRGERMERVAKAVWQSLAPITQEDIDTRDRFRRAYPLIKAARK